MQPTGVDYLIGIAGERNAPESVQRAFQDIALSRDGALFDINQSPRQQLRDYELTALQILEIAVWTASQVADEESLREVVVAACRLATRWKAYLNVVAKERI